MNNASDFVISKGVLKKYKGYGGDVIIPDSVIAIGDHAFYDCEKLTGIDIPRSVASIGKSAFSGCRALKRVKLQGEKVDIGSGAFKECESLADVNGFIILHGVLFGYYGFEKHIRVPDGVTSISDSAFAENKEIVSIVLPDGVKKIGYCAFYHCDNLINVEMPNSIESIGKSAFSGCRAMKQVKLPGKDIDIGAGAFEECENLADQKGFVIVQNIIFGYFGNDTVIEIPSGVTAISRYAFGNCRNITCITIPNSVVSISAFAFWNCESLCNVQIGNESNEVCGAFGECTGLIGMIPDELASFGGTWLEKNVPQSLQRRKTQEDLKNDLKQYYGLTFADLPPVSLKSGEKAPAALLAALLLRHEEMNGSVNVVHRCASLHPEAEAILKSLDQEDLQAFLHRLANSCLGLKRQSPKMYLAYPICRYANEELLANLIKQTATWSKNGEGLQVFQQAIVYNSTHAAMLYADKNGLLELYAALRGTDVDSLRDRHLSDVGLDNERRKVYDLGNQCVTVCLQKDLTFVVELPGGKIAKSLPKKGADEEKYADANADFSNLKKKSKEIIANRRAVLFTKFLSGSAQKADSWQAAYMHNPLLRTVAELVVWSQDSNTFTLSAHGPVTADDAVYVIGTSPVCVAHPVDMSVEERNAWQNYFTSRGLKQPFEQVWEPVVDAGTVTPDRYKNCLIPFCRFVGREKHGIAVQDQNFHNDIQIMFDDCTAKVARIDWARHEIDMNHRFEVQYITFGELTRKVNHILAYLDRITVYDLIVKDDVSVAKFLPSFTLAQITEFIKLASENNCPNVTAILLDFQQKNFPEFDPMAEFTLD